MIVNTFSGARLVRTLLMAISLLVAVVLTGCSSSGSPSSDASGGANGTTVSLKSLMFTPEDLKIKVGTTVTWVNDEPITHTVTSGEVTGLDKSTGLRTGQKPDGLFNETLSGSGDSFSYTFDKPGTYSYYCDIHFGMNAEIVVTK